MSGSYKSADATVSARRALAVSSSDVTVIPTTRALYVGTGGDLAVKMAEDDVNVTFLAVPSGTIFPVQVVQVLATGTTASGIVALW